MRWYLSSGGHANSAAGDGQLSAEALPAQAGFDEYRYDPANPVMSKGGPICCTGDPRRDRSGPVDQQEVEARPDVLVYTTPPLQKSVRIVGPVRARLVISTSARDTDFVAKLVDVDASGRALNIQEGALRLRYRDGFKQPQLATPGERYEIVVDMRATALYLPAGHRLRLQVTSSNFPRLERNLNTGGRNYDETVGVVAVNRVYHGPDAPSALEVQVLDDEDALPPSSAPERISLGRAVGVPEVSRSMK
jgi:putative CocE/NonD family hydrolase